MFQTRLVSAFLLATFAPIALGLGGCGSTVGQNAASHALKAPELPTDKQAKCRVAKSQSEPLIVEWPDAARGRLESVSRRGLVAVRYEGCELAVLSRCTVKSSTGGYGYSPITRKQSKVTIKDADELYASMPVGAVKLEGKLQSSGQLEVQMTIVGRYESTSQRVYRDDLEGDCSEATHVIAALTVGSFTFSAGADAEVGGGASVLGAGGAAKSTATRETIQRDGDEASCARATIADKTPPEGCGALLQIEVMPLAKGAKAAVAPLVVPVPVPAPGPSDNALVDPAVSAVPKCKRGEHLEDGVCVKLGARTVARSAVKSTVASATRMCAAGQHSYNGRCVDDDLPSEPSAAPSCVAGTHIENGACVVNTAEEPSSSSSSRRRAPSGYTPPHDDGVREVPNPWRGLLAYVAIGTGLSAGAFGVGALAAAGKAAEGCDATAKTCTAEAAKQRSTATTMAVLADISLGLTVLSVVGIFLLPSKVKVGAAKTQGGFAASASWQF